MGMVPVSQLSHVLLVVISAVIVLCVGIMLADGQSVIVLKDDLPIVTNPQVMNATLAALLGKAYGIGLHHDSSGRAWNHIDDEFGTLRQMINRHGVSNTVNVELPIAIDADVLKHPVTFFDCSDLRAAGLGAMAFGFIAACGSGLMLIIHTTALAGLLPNKCVKYMALLLWATASAGFVTMIVLASSVYTATWECEQPIIPTLKLDDHFDLSYGMGFLVVGAFSSILAVLITAFGISSENDLSPLQMVEAAAAKRAKEAQVAAQVAAKKAAAAERLAVDWKKYSDVMSGKEISKVIDVAPTPAAALSI